MVNVVEIMMTVNVVVWCELDNELSQGSKLLTINYYWAILIEILQHQSSSNSSLTIWILGFLVSLVFSVNILMTMQILDNLNQGFLEKLYDSFRGIWNMISWFYSILKWLKMIFSCTFCHCPSQNLLCNFPCFCGNLKKNIGHVLKVFFFISVVFYIYMFIFDNLKVFLISVVFQFSLPRLSEYFLFWVICHHHRHHHCHHRHHHHHYK